MVTRERNGDFEQLWATCAPGHETGWGRPHISAAASSDPRAVPFPNHSLCQPALAQTDCRYTHNCPYLHLGQHFDVIGAEELLGAQGDLLWVGVH